MKHSVLLILIIATGLSGCADTIAERKSYIPFSSANPNQHGIVFVALGTQSDPSFETASIVIRPRGQGGKNFHQDLEMRPHLHRAYFKYEKNSSSSYENTVLIANFSDSDAKGTISAVALPAGDYEIFSFQWTWANRYASTDNYFSAPFHISPGEAIYIGRFIAKFSDLKMKDSIIGPLYDPRGAYYNITNQYDKDSDLFKGFSRISSEFKVIDGGLPICTLKVAECPN